MAIVEKPGQGFSKDEIEKVLLSFDKNMLFNRILYQSLRKPFLRVRVF